MKKKHMTPREKWQHRHDTALKEWKLANPMPKKDAKKWQKWQNSRQVFSREWQRVNQPPQLTQKEKDERAQGQVFLDAMSGLMADILEKSE